MPAGASPRESIRRGLYLLTPDRLDTGELLARVGAVLAHASLLQYRNKMADEALLRAQILALLPLCRDAGVPLIVNDHWRLAHALGAEGAHLGADDGSLQDARRTVGDSMLLGASCYDSLERARTATAAGADYIAFGSFFASPTKPAARRADTSLLRDASTLGLPRVAIGGITTENARGIVEAGADLIAVISGVFDADDPAEAARHYAACFAR